MKNSGSCTHARKTNCMLGKQPNTNNSRKVFTQLIKMKAFTISDQKTYKNQASNNDCRYFKCSVWFVNCDMVDDIWEQDNNNAP